MRTGVTYLLPTATISWISRGPEHYCDVADTIRAHFLTLNTTGESTVSEPG